MLTVNSIKNGIVIDHIKAGHGIKIFNYLGLDKVNYSVALIMNAESPKLGRKDIIKIENELELDFAVLGFIDPNITIDIIESGVIMKKINLRLPERVENVVRCKNPRCITSVERNISHVFYLVDEKSREYKCKYCDELYKILDISSEP